MRKLILVNGIPASGKSSVAKIIADHFNAPLLSIDEIKEPFMIQFAHVIDRALNRKLGSAAYEAMFKIIAASPENTLFVLDAWFGFKERSLLEHYLSMVDSQNTIEIWNKISVENVVRRYQSRCGDRIKGHPGEEYIPELKNLAMTAAPMALSDVYIVDQNNPVDYSDINSWVSDRLNKIES
ncbi:MAG: hypothetical protein XXXJIFNMEKO3_02698 [Candidatus Erwinia impunctatus]|nr:hypothetical protein XXXJIFNMEKO_02698 [Culicoides impunctatus]